MSDRPTAPVFETLDPRRLLSGTTGSGEHLDPGVRLIYESPEVLTVADINEISRRSVLPDVTSEVLRRRVGVEVDGPRLTPNDFLVYDLTPLNFEHNLDASSDSSRIVQMTLRSDIWTDLPGGGVDRRAVDHKKVGDMAQRVAERGEVLVFNIEHLPMDVRKDSAAEVEASMAIFQEVADAARAAAPDLKLGFYRMMPLRDYWTPQQFDRALDRYLDGDTDGFEVYLDRYQQWQQANEFLTPLAEQVDVIFPSLYTFYADRSGWQNYAERNLAEARKFGKPVVPFLWPRYHPSSDRPGQFIEGDFWRAQLETTRRLADGVAIWDSVTRSPYSGNEGWHRQTLDFADDLERMSGVFYGEPDELAA